jgi:hypothetical protein
MLGGGSRIDGCDAKGAPKRLRAGPGSERVGQGAFALHVGLGGEAGERASRALQIADQRPEVEHHERARAAR